MDDSRIRTELGFEPGYSLEAAVEDYVRRTRVDSGRVSPVTSIDRPTS